MGMSENSHNPRGHTGIAFYSPQSPPNIGSVVRSAGCFGMDYVIIIGEEYDGNSADVGHYRHLPVFTVPDWESLEEFSPKNSEIILIDYDSSAYEISEFTHPERGLYVIGNEGKGFPEKILEKGYRRVYINSEFCLNAAVAGAIIMRERYES